MAKRVLIKLAAVLLGLYLIFLGLLFAGQRTMLYPRPRQARPIGTLMQREQVADLLGAMPALYRPAAGGRPTVVFFHGNGSQLADADWLATRLSPSGLGVFSVEYPGYAGAPGEPTEESIIRVSAEGLERLEALGVPRGSMVLLGQSLGTGVAVQLAARGYGSRLILVSPYTSIAQLAADRFPAAPAALVLDRFDSFAYAPKIDLPVLAFHGADDEVIPYASGQRVCALFPHCALVTLPGAHHNDVLDRADVLKQIVDFALGSP